MERAVAVKTRDKTAINNEAMFGRRESKFVFRFGLCEEEDN